ncbi:hypothetical protein NOK12_02660 [Nocardioides sp. OK12]|nr:hypothetical protein NOK12_02660 [Nocardioides sp. OK12]
MGLQGMDRVAWRVLAPEVVDEVVGRHRVALAGREPGEHRLLLASADAQVLDADAGFDRTEDKDLEHGTWDDDVGSSTVAPPAHPCERFVRAR